MDRAGLDAELADFFSSDEEVVTPSPAPLGYSGVGAQRPNYQFPRGSAGAAAAAVAARGPLVLPPAAPPPPTSQVGRGVPTLQACCCSWLARHLHLIDDLDDLPPHLKDLVLAAIEADRRLLDDAGLAVWLGAVLNGCGTTTRLCLRWASGLTDASILTLAEQPLWAERILHLDLAFCDGLGDYGCEALARVAPQLESLSISGCRRIGDEGVKALGREMCGLQALELQLLPRITDFGIQAVVRGCSNLTSLLLGGCAQLSNISSQLITQHLRHSLRRLDLSGLKSLLDVDLDDLRRCHSITHISLTSCGRLTDTAAAHLSALCSAQNKRIKAEDRHTLSTTVSAGQSNGAPVNPQMLSHGAELTNRHSSSSSSAMQAENVAVWYAASEVTAAAQAGNHAAAEAAVERGEAAAAAASARALTVIELGGLTRLTDAGLDHLLDNSTHVRRLDLRGCTSLTYHGVCKALGAQTRRPALEQIVLTAVGLSPRDIEQLRLLLGSEVLVSGD